MRERMIPDLMSFMKNSRGNGGEPVGLVANQKECRGGVLLLQDVEDLWRPLRIGAIIECDYDLIGTRSVACHTIGLRQSVHHFVGDESVGMVEGDSARAVGGSGFQVQDFA